jgi:asparagine synthase (glutamine-hydrolysing)
VFAGYEYFRRYPLARGAAGRVRPATARLAQHELQRVDRMTMAHGLEGRVPFLDLDFVD